MITEQKCFYVTPLFIMIGKKKSLLEFFIIIRSEGACKCSTSEAAEGDAHFFKTVTQVSNCNNKIKVHNLIGCILGVLHLKNVLKDVFKLK